jgi:DNA-binding HxlR family transcriptional regulator
MGVCELHMSRLQVCVEVLCVLSSRGPLEFRQIRRRTEFEGSVLKEYLVFLVDRGLIEKQSKKNNKKGYVLSARGYSVLRVLAPLVKEAYRIELQNFKAISSSLEKVTFPIKTRSK